MNALKVDRTKLITQSEYAKLRGVTPSAIKQQINKGMINTVEIKGATLVYLG